MTAATEPGLQRVTQAFGAFLACLDAGLRPALSSEITTPGNWRDGEFDVVISRNEMYGATHEEIAAALRIAEEHGGRLWHDNRDGKLAILFTPPKEPGPDPTGDESPAETRERRARPKRKRQAKITKEEGSDV